jgi:adenylyltransferase/sulfurtransferase
VEIEAYPERLDAARAVDLFPRYDVVIDGCDDFVTKLLASDAGRKFGVPVVHGSVLRFDGQVAVFSDGEGPCLRCLFPEPPAHETPCAEAGVLGAVTGWVGSVQALEAIKLLLRSPELPPIEGKLAILDGVALSLRTVGIPKREGCATCSVPREAVRLVPAREPASPSREEISAEELARLHRNGSPLRLVDVREAEETRAGAIEGAIHYPLSRLRSDGPPEGGPGPELVLYCATGRRTRIALEMLRASGIRARHLRGGYAAWKAGRVPAPGDFPSDRSPS